MKQILLIPICVFVAACAEKSVDLGDGYKYVQLDRTNAAIADADSHMVVEPNVKQYRVVGSYIVGERVDANIDKRLSKSFGYFVFDMRSGKPLEGLDKAKLEEALRARSLNVNQF